MTLELTLRPGEVLLRDGATLRLDADVPCCLSIDGISRPNCPLAVIDRWEAAKPDDRLSGKAQRSIQWRSDGKALEWPLAASKQGLQYLGVKMRSVSAIVWPRRPTARGGRSRLAPITLGVARR